MVGVGGRREGERSPEGPEVKESQGWEQQDGQTLVQNTVLLEDQVCGGGRERVREPPGSWGDRDDLKALWSVGLEQGSRPDI